MRRRQGKERKGRWGSCRNTTTRVLSIRYVDRWYEIVVLMMNQDDDLLNRDYTAATESAVDMSMLPKVMQVRNFGKVRRLKAFSTYADGGRRCRGRNTPTLPIKTRRKVDGAWRHALLLVRLGLQLLVAGTVRSFTRPQPNADPLAIGGGPHNRKGTATLSHSSVLADQLSDCPNNNINDPNAMPSGSGLGTSANTATLGFGGGAPQRSWGGGEERNDARGVGSASQDKGNGSGYRDSGRERRFEEERRGVNARDTRHDGYEKSRERGKDGDGEREHRRGHDGRPDRDADHGARRELGHDERRREKEVERSRSRSPRPRDCDREDRHGNGDGERRRDVHDSDRRRDDRDPKRRRAERDAKR